MEYEMKRRKFSILYGVVVSIHRLVMLVYSYLFFGYLVTFFVNGYNIFKI